MTRTASIGLALGLGLAAALWGCHDNEESFYIEHMKVISDPPECKYTTGDAFTPSITVDLAVAQEYDFYGTYQVTNALMVREDYDNLKAESNGIMIDGSEVVVSVGGQSVGASEYRDVDMFIEAETTSIVPGITLTSGVFESMAGALGCTPASDSAQSIAENAYAGEEPAFPESESLGSGYATVRFLGHTQGGLEVETNPFTIAIDLCCNCFVDWSYCVNPCNGFCTIVEPSSCAQGIDEAAIIPCPYWMRSYYDPFDTWQEEQILESDGGTIIVDVNCSTCTPTGEE